jgi:hypothetical protein
MTHIVTSPSPAAARRKTGWFRRAALGAAVAATGLLSLGAAPTPAQAHWYGYGYYPYYHPHYYGWYGYRPAYWGWGGGWHHGWGWRHGYYHHR